MHYSVFGINFLLHSVSLILIILLYTLLIPLTYSHLLRHHHSHHPSLPLSSTPVSKHTCSTILSTIDPLPPDCQLDSNRTTLTDFCTPRQFSVLVFHYSFILYYAIRQQKKHKNSKYINLKLVHLYTHSTHIICKN